MNEKEKEYFKLFEELKKTFNDSEQSKLKDYLNWKSDKSRLDNLDTKEIFFDPNLLKIPLSEMDGVFSSNIIIYSLITYQPGSTTPEGIYLKSGIKVKPVYKSNNSAYIEKERTWKDSKCIHRDNVGFCKIPNPIGINPPQELYVYIKMPIGKYIGILVKPEDIPGIIIKSHSILDF